MRLAGVERPPPSPPCLRPLGSKQIIIVDEDEDEEEVSTMHRTHACTADTQPLAAHRDASALPPHTLLREAHATAPGRRRRAGRRRKTRRRRRRRARRGRRARRRKRTTSLRCAADTAYLARLVARCKEPASSSLALLSQGKKKKGKDKEGKEGKKDKKEKSARHPHPRLPSACRVYACPPSVAEGKKGKDDEEGGDKPKKKKKK